jgi:hypothetical protein
MQDYLAYHPDCSLDRVTVEELTKAMEEVLRTPAVANLLFEDRLSLRQTLARHLIKEAKLGSVQDLTKEGVAFMCRSYTARWRN